MGSYSFSKIVCDFLIFCLQTFVFVVHGRTTITVSLASQGSIEKSLWTILRADICKLYPKAKVYLGEGIPNSRKQPQTTKFVVEKELVFAAPAKFSSRQTRTAIASSDCLRLVTEVNLSVYMLSRKRIQHNKNNNFSSTKGTRPLKYWADVHFPINNYAEGGGIR